MMITKEGREKGRDEWTDLRKTMQYFHKVVHYDKVYKYQSNYPRLKMVDKY